MGGLIGLRRYLQLDLRIISTQPFKDVAQLNQVLPDAAGFGRDGFLILSRRRVAADRFKDIESALTFECQGVGPIGHAR